MSHFSIVCIQRGAVLEAGKPIVSQIQLVNFSEGSPYETLHFFVSGAMASYFKSYVIKVWGRADACDGDKMVPSVEKKISELEMGFLHLQQTSLKFLCPSISL